MLLVILEVRLFGSLIVHVKRILALAELPILHLQNAVLHVAIVAVTGVKVTPSALIM